MGVRDSAAHLIRQNLGIDGLDDQALPALVRRIDHLEWLAKNSARHDDKIHQLTIALARIHAVTSWIDLADVREDVLVSVVMPTRNRRELIGHAIRSVLAQRHRNFQLIIVDDGSDEDYEPVLRSFKDPRIELHRIPPSGHSRACNVGIAHARGSIIAYLDDDNVMMSGWLRAVVWAFDRFPEKNVLYGATVKERVSDSRALAVDMPQIDFFPWDRRKMEEACLVGQNVLAHRSGLPEAYFDEQLADLTDWDLVLRLTTEESPIELPYIASAYYTSAPKRMAHLRSPEHYAALRERHPLPKSS